MDDKPQKPSSIKSRQTSKTRKPKTTIQAKHSSPHQKAQKTASNNKPDLTRDATPQSENAQPTVNVHENDTHPKAAEKEHTVTATSVQTQAVKPAVETNEQDERGIWKNFFKCYEKYFDFSGRASRYEYFSFTLVYYLLSFLFGFLTAFHPLFSIVSILFVLLSVIPTFAVMNRRLHDIGRNLWNGYFNWIIYGALAGAAAGLIMFFGFKAYKTNLSNWPLYTFLMFVFTFGIATIIRYLVFICRRGQTSENKYGAVPALDSPAGEKSAFKLIVVYFTLVIAMSILSGLISYFEAVDLQKRTRQTDMQLSALEQYIHYIGRLEGNYAWLDNGVALRQPLISEDMFTDDRQGITTALGLPVNVYGFDDMFAIALEEVDETACRTIASTRWHLENVDEMMIRNDNAVPPIQQTLMHPNQCEVCEDGMCEIFWKIN